MHLPAFWIQRTEVTVAQFRAFVEATGYAGVSGMLGDEGAGPGVRRPFIGFRVVLTR